MRDGPYTRLVHAVMGARNPPVKDATAPLMNNGDVAILLDAGFKGNKARLLQPWKQGVQDLKKKMRKSSAMPVSMKRCLTTRTVLPTARLQVLSQPC